MSGIKIVSEKGVIVEFGVTSLPDRKSKALYIERNSTAHILAYFRDDACAKIFEKIIEGLADSTNAKE